MRATMARACPQWRCSDVDNAQPNINFALRQAMEFAFKRPRADDSSERLRRKGDPQVSLIEALEIESTPTVEARAAPRKARP